MASRNNTAPLNSGKLSAVRPPVLPPNVYLQYLQVKEKFPRKMEFEALKLAYERNKNPPAFIKTEIDSPLHMSHKDIEEVLTTLAELFSSPILAGHG